MAITRINHFEAKIGSEQALYEFLVSVISIVKSCAGCIDCHLLRSIENPANLVIIEQWDDVESHQKAASAVPPEKLKEVFALFAKPASGMYYSESH
jgi:quinol monooxygenase YgiN